MTDSGLGGLELDPATRALLEFANSPAMKQAQLAFRDLAESPAVKQAQRLAAVFRDLPESPAIKQAQRLAAAFRDLPESPALKQAQQLAAAFRDLPESPAVRQAQRLAAAFSGFADSPAMKEAQKLASAFRVFAASTPHDLLTVDAIKGLAIVINADLTDSASSLENFSKSSAGRIIREIAHSQITKAENEAEAPAHSIGSFRSDGNPISIVQPDIHHEILRSLSAIRDTLEANGTSRSEKLLSIYIYPAVLAFLSVILSAYLSSYDFSELSSSMRDDLKSGDERVIHRITEKLYEIEISIDRLARREEPNTSFYLVIRAVPLNWQKKYSGSHYILLQPGQRVEVLRRSGKWLEVRTTLADHTEVAGWVLKKYLRSLR